MQTEVLEIALFTTVAALAATVVMLPPGIALAWVLARHRFRGKAVVETLARSSDQVEAARGSRPESDSQR